MPKASGVKSAAAIGLLTACTALAGPRPIDLSAMVDRVSHEQWPAGQAPAGSGFLVAPQGTVFTAAHVIAGCRRIFVSLRSAPDHPVPATLIGQDSRIDAAILSAPKLKARGPFLRFADDLPPAGSRLTISAQLGGAKAQTATSLGLADEPIAGRVFHFRTTISAGSSGAPVLDGEGKVVAFVVGKLENNPSVAVGVPSSNLIAFRAYFGIDEPPHPKASAQPDPANKTVLVTCK